MEQCALVCIGLSGDGVSALGVQGAVRDIEAQLRSVLLQEEGMRAAALSARQAAAAAGAAPSSSSGKPGPSAEAGGEDAEDEDEQEQEEEGAEGAALMSDALQRLAKAREHLTAAQALVKTYARSFQLDAAELGRLGARLQRLDKLLRAQRCRSSEELLALAAGYAARLEQFYEAEGQQVRGGAVNGWMAGPPAC